MKPKIFLTHAGVTDSIDGWAARLGLHKVYFRKRYGLYKNDPTKLFARRLKTGPINPLRGKNNPNFKHGLRKTKAYQVWIDMMCRCYDPKTNSYPDYGGRGIKVCKSWHSLQRFYTDMGDPPPKLTIERKNNDKGYSKRNCKWATRKEQQNNRRPRKRGKGARTPTT